MANWLNKIKLQDIIAKIQSGKIDIPEGGMLVANRIKTLRKNLKVGQHAEDKEFYQDQLEDIEINFGVACDEEEFDSALESLYDLGDVPLSRDDRLIWVDFYGAPSF
jgi:hypothetical protein